MNKSSEGSVYFLKFWPSPNETDFDDFSMLEETQNDTAWLEHDDVDDFREVEPAILFLGILLLILAMVLQVFSILYERFEMDSMKRGFTNQMITTHFAWALLMSIILVLRFSLTLLPFQLPAFIALGLQFLKTVVTLGICLTIIEATIFEYWSHLILKRVPEYDHDFLATGCQVANIVLAFYFGGLQTYGKSKKVLR